MTKKEKKAIPFIIMGLIVCLFAMVCGVSMMIDNIEASQKLKEYSQTEGRVIDIRTEQSGSTTFYISIVEYSVDGTKYTLAGPYYQKNRKDTIGTEKVIYYNPENPADGIMQENIDYTWYSLLMLFLFLLGMGIMWGFYFFMRKKGYANKTIYGVIKYPNSEDGLNLSDSYQSIKEDERHLFDNKSSSWFR